MGRPSVTFSTLSYIAILCVFSSCSNGAAFMSAASISGVIVTAEVAILNKLGIALAADSAVTISEGTDSRKVFNTADKLFQLSRKQSIACMVFSNLQFMQAPLQVLVKEFRN